MTFKILRRGTPRCIGLLSLLVVAIVCLYYISIGQQYNPKNLLKRRTENAALIVDNNLDDDVGRRNIKETHSKPSANDVTNHGWRKCVALKESDSDITTQEEFYKFDFQPNWLRNKEFWDMSFETRYEALKRTDRPNLRVFITPFSHNDPGWLKTFLGYFQQDSRQILNFVVDRMQEYKDMTFIWAEITILQLWWDQAHPTKQRALKQLINSGRFEIVTGGWVMTDEANVHLYAMVDQLIEGHQWLKDNLNYTPTTGFSIDPFGHGSTLPYLLAASEFKGTIIQRIHYAWKQYFAKNQYGDFYWQPYWKSENADSRTLLTHNMPFDIYSIKHSCGPHPSICLNFDFRKVPGEYTEYSIKAQFINEANVEAKADLLLEQYAKAATLYPHNVAFVPLGDDFRYNREKEVEQQYTNYKLLIDYINAHPDRYNNTQISFGLPKDYFDEINRRYQKYPHLKGDFFVYSDIFTEGKPAYWSGYFTTRPMYKMLSRELEHNLRCAEILFTIALNHARQHHNTNALRIFEKNYEKMIIARRNLGLFQHHDAITGTSKAMVMRDYGSRLFESIRDTVQLQQTTIEMLMQNKPSTEKYHIIVSELERDSFNRLPKKTPIVVHPNKQAEIVLFNALAQDRLELIALRTRTPNLKVIDNNGMDVKFQINPVWNITDDNQQNVNLLRASNHIFEVIFLANLPPLALVTYTVKYTEKRNSLATVYCNECKESNAVDRGEDVFEVKARQAGDIQLENAQMRLLFDGVNGFLKTITPKNHRKPVQCAIKFAAYRSAQFHSGAYLFKPDREEKDSEKDVLEQYNGNQLIFITSGQISSDVTVIYGNFLAHTIRIFNSGTSFDSAIYIENDINFEAPPKNRETELFMRFVTSIDNGVRSVMYSDQSGFQYHRREKVQNLGVEANYYPITTAAFIQDSEVRLSLLTNHAQGAASLEPGYLEVMLDRRTLYDDYRGMGEGIVDSQLTQQRYWLILEQMIEGANDDINNIPPVPNRDYETPSSFVNHLSNILNYPANVFFVENQDDTTPNKLSKQVSLFKMNFPCDVHLATLRTQTERDLTLFPSQRALLLLQRQAASCKVRDIGNVCQNEHGFKVNDLDIFNNITLARVFKTSLTGVHQHDRITHFNSVYIQPMDMATFNLTFV
ncbi:alpha-mannosidase 2 [Contarinia nasturtii]|uniref:alpha-mannosidase 2 n=1 Tax=Contarinia nasturtii TaxID=265458 RepID=UPI0012D3F468|nr:alpha-mannosidase 2 [Contarinia nasturtii]XP_031624641.1 alpha-mannosidase 2 [Contarinia nasturtii]